MPFWRSSNVTRQKALLQTLSVKHEYFGSAIFWKQINVFSSTMIVVEGLPTWLTQLWIIQDMDLRDQDQYFV